MNPTLNSPDRNELRAQLGRLVHGDYHAIHGWDTPLVNKLLEIFDAHLSALQQTIEAGLPGKLNMDDAMLNHGWTDEEYIAWNKALRNCQAAITKAFEAAKAEKDSK